MLLAKNIAFSSPFRRFLGSGTSEKIMRENGLSAALSLQRTGREKALKNH
jgi:hypothetical protein